MSDRIAEIRTRHSKRSEIDPKSGCYRLDGYTYLGSLAQSQEDVATLLAEIERLRKALQDIAEDCEDDYPPSHGAIKYAVQDALRGKP